MSVSSSAGPYPDKVSWTFKIFSPWWPINFYSLDKNDVCFSWPTCMFSLFLWNCFWISIGRLLTTLHWNPFQLDLWGKCYWNILIAFGFGNWLCRFDRKICWIFFTAGFHQTTPCMNFVITLKTSWVTILFLKILFTWEV